MQSGPFERGEPVRVEMGKWGDRPHWEYDAVWLGSDEHGDWVGIAAGTPITRPGATYLSTNDHVTLAPALDAEDRWWVATFHAPGGPRVTVYVDITTPPAWDGTTLRAVDLDLDVVRGVSGRVWIDDEDEFAQHRMTLGYPEDVVERALRSCVSVERLVTSRAAPYDGSHLGWLDLLATLSPRS